ncbi:MAG TPA: cysteine peptidase family C39 domain-containing protein, partial [Polyangia bacterium]|nr:cysteine peptidase family C39 domain-containing protein [Polyangia bacterium]
MNRHPALAVWLRQAAVLLSVGVAGCYQGSARSVSLQEIARQPGWLVVDGVTLVRQDGAHDCGPAALAMVLARWGIASSEPEIREALAAKAT